VIPHQARQRDEEGRADADQGVGPQPGDVLMDLPLQADRDPHQHGDGDIQDEMDDIHQALPAPSALEDGDDSEGYRSIGAAPDEAIRRAIRGAAAA
jgi:hypothetical protein